MDIRTARLTLHPVDEQEARRIRGRAPEDGERWAADYPFDGDLAAVGSLLRATERTGDQRPFGYYQIRRRADGLAVGGIGFKGPPERGTVEVGYGLAPSARGEGYAGEALAALVGMAAELGITVVRADTELDNIASQRTLEHAGFAPTGVDAGLRYYEIRVRDSPAT